MGIRPVLIIIIILLNYLIPMQWSNGKEVVWIELPTSWRLNLCPEIISNVPREMITGELKLPRAGYQRIGAIDLNPEGTGIDPPPIIHIVVGFINHLHDM
jgi:hypothetical protein